MALEIHAPFLALLPECLHRRACEVDTSCGSGADSSGATGCAEWVPVLRVEQHAAQSEPWCAKFFLSTV